MTFNLTKHEIECLCIVVENGPAWAGNFPSSNDRNSLVNKGLITPTVVNGEEGYYCVTQEGIGLYKKLFHFPNTTSDTVEEAIRARKFK